ncbi:hypothetical protein FRB99_000244 [Tulasnella sp. 403]|nr:hypothetical protein FRB99_000244 [Tulasnella sp. 403]
MVLRCTNDPEQALAIQFMPSHEPFRIRMINVAKDYGCSEVTVLCLNPEGQKTNTGLIGGSPHPGSKRSWGCENAGLVTQPATWTLMFDGTLVPTWQDGRQTYCQAVLVNDAKGYLVTMENPKLLRKAVARGANAPWAGVRLVFEPGV